MAKCNSISFLVHLRYVFIHFLMCMPADLCIIIRYISWDSRASPIWRWWCTIACTFLPLWFVWWIEVILISLWCDLIRIVTGKKSYMEVKFQKQYIQLLPPPMLDLPLNILTSLQKSLTRCHINLCSVNNLYFLTSYLPWVAWSNFSHSALF